MTARKRLTRTEKISLVGAVMRGVVAGAVRAAIELILKHVSV